MYRCCVCTGVVHVQVLCMYRCHVRTSCIQVLCTHRYCECTGVVYVQCHVCTGVVHVQVSHTYRHTQILWMYRCCACTGIVNVQVLCMYRCRVCTGVVYVQVSCMYRCCVRTGVVYVQVLSWVEWGFYALSASKAIFRARTYNCNLFSPVMMITWWMKLGGNRPPGDNPLLFSISGTG